MNRADGRHQGSRVELPRVVRYSLSLKPLTSTFLALAGFMTCGGAVVATALLVALQIR